MKFLVLAVASLSFVSLATATPPPAATRPYCGGHCGSGSYNHGGGWNDAAPENVTCIAVSARRPSLAGYGYGHSVNSACSLALANCNARSISHCRVQSYSSN